MYDIDTFKKIVGDRDIFIFSLNIEGLGTARLLRKQGFRVGGFVDSRDFGYTKRDGFPIIGPDNFFKSNSKENAFVIIASKNRKMKREFSKILERHDFKKHRDYVRILEDLCDYMPTIEIVGNCNLRCISCESGHKDAVRTGFMSIDMYRKILEKMTKEIPFLNSVYLYLWGEPLLHPKIDEFIKITKEFGLASDVSTNLNFVKHLEKFVASNPDYIAVPCSGVGKNYEITHTGGDWETFKKNLFLLRKYIDQYKVESTVRIMFHLYKHNINGDFHYVKNLANDLGFQFYPIIAHAFPGKIYDHIVYGKPLPPEIEELNNYLIYPIEDQLKFAYEHRNMKCPVWKVFPTIRSDGSVLICCNMMHYVLYPNYLNISLAELNSIREGNEICKKCMEKGLHRYFDVSCEVIEKEDGLEIRRLL